MSGGGGKGGSQTSTTEMDPRLEELGVATGVGALRTAAMPFRPIRGVQIAAFNPQQQAAFAGASEAAGALGLANADPSVMPAPEVNSMGIAGYDPSYVYDTMVGKSFTAEDLAEREAISQYYADKAVEIEDMPREFRGGGGGGK